MQNQFTAVTSSHAICGVVCAAVSWFIFALSQPHSAEAAALSNKDSSAYKIDVITKNERRQHELAPGKSISGFCKAGCIIRLNENEANDYELEGSERVSIEGGLVYYDGEEIKKATGEPAKSK